MNQFATVVNMIQEGATRAEIAKAVGAKPMASYLNSMRNIAKLWPDCACYPLFSDEGSKFIFAADAPVASEGKSKPDKKTSLLKRRSQILKKERQSAVDVAELALIKAKLEDLGLDADAEFDEDDAEVESDGFADGDEN